MIPKILVIEDDRDIREYLKEFLTDNNFSVHAEEKGISGLEYLKKKEPDLVLLDLGLPDIDGESVCIEIRKNYPEIPVIILTAKNSVDDKVKALNVGADDYVTKPFVADELLARVHARLRNKLPNNSKVTIGDRKSTRLNSSHQIISYAVFCLKKKKRKKKPNEFITGGV